MTEGGSPPEGPGTRDRTARDGTDDRSEQSERLAGAEPTGEPPTARPAAMAEEAFYCDLCGNPMLNLHCKLICEQCGYKRDCSDP